MENPGYLSYFSEPYSSGNTDGFIYVFNAGLTSNSLNTSTFFGGAGDEDVRDVAYISNDNLAISGSFTGVGSVNNGFPLDNPGSPAIFSDNLNSSVENHGFFSAFCEEVPVSIEDINMAGASNLFDVYPNPFSTRVTVSGPLDGLLTYSLYDISGRLILTKNIASDKSFDIDLKLIESGTYILLIETESQISSSKIIKL